MQINDGEAPAVFNALSGSSFTGDICSVAVSAYQQVKERLTWNESG
jgi:hypothetical protein